MLILLALLAFAGPPGCASLPPLNDDIRTELLRMPVVLVLVKGDPPEQSQLGSAVVLSSRDLLLTPHQVPADSGICRVDGKESSFRVLERCEGLSESGGWAVIRLQDPLAHVMPLAFDFRSELPSGAALYVVGFPQDEGGSIPAGEPDDTKRIIPGRLEGGSVPFEADPAVRDQLAEFELFRVASLPRGTSGGAVMMRLSPAGPWVCVGICGGRGEESTGGATYGLLRRPHELDLAPWSPAVVPADSPDPR